MFFVPDIAALDPITHAVNFWIAICSGDQFPFGDSQALFNAPIIGTESLAAYHWVFEALEKAIDSIPTWRMELTTLKKVLAVLQGIAWPCITARGMRSLLDDIQRLHNKIHGYLNGKDILGSESIIKMVFHNVASLLNGQPMTSWVSEPTSESEAARRLNDSNSDIGPHRCLIADSFENAFTFIDQTSTNEALYMFDEKEVDMLALDFAKGLVLRFKEDHGSRLPMGSLKLEHEAVTKESVHGWIARFLHHKLG
ncbi:MAG: hypothetical protein Q9225_005904 [Loekoesia sp. 1 TL-2023]